MNKKNNQGQILLITVMLLATALTVALSVSFKSTTDTQITKLEEESQKTLAAAEAGIEAALKGNVGRFSSHPSLLGNLSGIDLTNSNSECNSSQQNNFTTPLLQKDEQYTFYLASYDRTTNIISGTYNNDIDLYFGQASTCQTLEITIFNSTGTAINRRLAKPSCDTTTTGNDLSVLSGAPFGSDTYSYKTTLDSTDLDTNAFVIVRVISPSALTTKLRFQSSISSINLPHQGNTCTSEAKTNSGVTKTVKLFQSYPQIPSEFFVTSF